MPHPFTDSCLRDSVALFQQYKRLGEGAMAQLDEAQLQARLDPEMNSIALIVKHLAGNMRSRWAGFPDADGESPARNRDSEFTTPPVSRAEVMRAWEEGWGEAFAALGRIGEADLGRRTFIRGEAHSILQAIHRQITHCAYHVGQIVFLAKHLRSEHWNSLSIPRNGSEAFNQRMAREQANPKESTTGS